MGNNIKNIEGVSLRKLNQFHDERGAVYHYINKSSPEFIDFGEIYFSKINLNIIKGWKCHSNSTQNMCVPFGSLKIMLFDNRPKSSTFKKLMEVFIDDSVNYSLLTIPPGIYYSFKCVANEFTILANIIDIEHENLNSLSIPLYNEFIPYKWD